MWGYNRTARTFLIRVPQSRKSCGTSNSGNVGNEEISDALYHVMISRRASIGEKNLTAAMGEGRPAVLPRAPPACGSCSPNRPSLLPHYDAAPPSPVCCVGKVVPFLQRCSGRWICGQQTHPWILRHSTDSAQPTGVDPTHPSVHWLGKRELTNPMRNTEKRYEHTSKFFFSIPLLALQQSAAQPQLHDMTLLRTTTTSS